jgi:hypothetical protein
VVLADDVAHRAAHLTTEISTATQSNPCGSPSQGHPRDPPCCPCDRRGAARLPARARRLRQRDARSSARLRRPATRRGNRALLAPRARAHAPSRARSRRGGVTKSTKTQTIGTVRAPLGHSPTLTLDTYAHVFSEFARGERINPSEQILETRVAGSQAGGANARSTIAASSATSAALRDPPVRPTPQCALTSAILMRRRATAIAGLPAAGTPGGLRRGDISQPPHRRQGGAPRRA